MVARVCEIASSHRIGRRTNDTGEKSVVNPPQYRVWITPPIKPMSWKSGSQKTPRLSRVEPKQWWMRAELWRRLPCVITTPFGADVEPEVYWRKASVSRSAPGSHQRP